MIFSQRAAVVHCLRPYFNHGVHVLAFARPQRLKHPHMALFADGVVLMRPISAASCAVLTLTASMPISSLFRRREISPITQLLASRLAAGFGGKLLQSRPPWPGFAER